MSDTFNQDLFSVIPWKEVQTELTKIFHDATRPDEDLAKIKSEDERKGAAFWKLLQTWHGDRSLLILSGLFGIAIPQDRQPPWSGWIEPVQEKLAQLIKEDETHPKPKHNMQLTWGCLALIPKNANTNQTITKIYAGGETNLNPPELDEKGVIALSERYPVNSEEIRADIELFSGKVGFPHQSIIPEQPTFPNLVIVQQPYYDTQRFMEEAEQRPIKDWNKQVDNAPGINRWIEQTCGVRLQTKKRDFKEKGRDPIGWEGQPYIPLVPRELPKDGKPLIVPAMLAADCTKRKQFGYDRKYPDEVICFERLIHRIIEPEDYKLLPLAKAAVRSQMLLTERYPNANIQIEGIDVAIKTLEREQPEYIHRLFPHLTPQAASQFQQRFK